MQDQAQPQSQPSSDIKIKHNTPIKLLIIILASVILGIGGYEILNTLNIFTFDVTSILASFIILFITAIMLHINYTSKFFIALVLTGIFLVSFFPFMEGMFVMILILLLQRAFNSS